MRRNSNLFSRLCSYSFNKQKLSRENFVTEVIAHLFNTDRAFRRHFLNALLRDGRVRRRFSTAHAQTQVSFPRCIIDLLLQPRNRKPLLVEVKITAGETQTKIHGSGSVPQIKKYLRLRRGLVAYLTSLQTPEADVRHQRRYLGQFSIEDLQQRLAHTKKLTPIGREFSEFLEEQDMAHPKPFTSREIRFSKDAFAFADKCQHHLDAIVSKFGDDFRRALKTKARFSKATFNTRWKSSYVYLKGFRRWPFRGAGFSIDPDSGKASFSVWLRVRNEDGAEAIPRKAGFFNEGGLLDWYESIELGGGPADRRRMHKCVDKAVAKLKKAI